MSRYDHHFAPARNGRLPGTITFACATVLVALTLSLSPAQQRRQTGNRRPYVPVNDYDPQRDAARDIRDAIKEAKRANKNILLEVGGEWCSWCHIFDNYFQANKDLLRLRDKNFVTLKINFSQENENEAVLALYPPITGYPHLFVLESSGKLLLSQETGALESGKSYSHERLTEFLTKWAPSRMKP